jgi:hypothetical protein
MVPRTLSARGASAASSLRLRRRSKVRAASLEPTRTRVPGSGTSVGVVTLAAALAELRERILLSEKRAGLVIPVHSILAEVRMSQLTVYLARFIDLFAVLVAAAFLVRGSTVVENTVADGSVMVVYAIISLAAGLAMILGHNVWSGGTLPVVVTLVGWLILAKGLLLFFVTPEALTRLLERMQYGEHYSRVYRTIANYRALYDLGRLHGSADECKAKINLLPSTPCHRDVSF